MNQENVGLRRGDFVEVKMPDEIATTLDADGAEDSLPFMPEMLEFCGQRFRVAMRALTTCFSGPGTTRGFRTDDVVTLDGVRCSGASHDGCQKACMIFWREAWLRKVEDSSARPPADSRATSQLRARLKVSTGPKTYYCQASQLSKATDPLSRWERLERNLRGVGVGNFNIAQMVRSLGIFFLWKIRRVLLGVYPRGGGQSPAPAQSLNLQPGEWVEVKPLSSIIETLNERGDNRGLSFTPYMRLFCGQRLKVKGRIDKIVVDGTGQMRQLRNTVWLEGSTCGCSYLGLGTGGCSRCEVNYWRESWLRRANDGSVAAPREEDRT
jgi:hypothetical protein